MKTKKFRVKEFEIAFGGVVKIMPSDMLEAPTMLDAVLYYINAHLNGNDREDIIDLVMQNTTRV